MRLCRTRARVVGGSPLVFRPVTRADYAIRAEPAAEAVGYFLTPAAAGDGVRRRTVPVREDAGRRVGGCCVYRCLNPAGTPTSPASFDADRSSVVDSKRRLRPGAAPSPFLS